MILLKRFMNNYINRRLIKEVINLNRSCNIDTSILANSYEEQLRNELKQFLSKIQRDGIQSENGRYLLTKKKKQRADHYTVDHFVDSRRVFVKAGNGGNGNISFLHLLYNEFAGMSGGDGGKGGHVLFQSDYAKSSLSNVKVMIRSAKGDDGSTKNLDGKNASNIVIRVPVGTKFNRDGKEICQLQHPGDIFIAARGGVGGKGNSFFTTDTLQYVNVAEYGGIGEEFIYHLQMEIIANVGLIGCPNAGKSTLLRAMSRARPEVASYPFTTLHPHIGSIQYEDFEYLRVADIPGLIEGSHRDEGLGIGFLCHIRRCSCLLYVIDMSQPDPIEQFNMLINELEHFSKGLSKTPHCLVANKMDSPQSQDNLSKFQNHFQKMITIPISAKYGQNLEHLGAVMRYISQFKPKDQEELDEYMEL